MPPKAKVNKQMILDAAFSIIRERGQEQLNARAIAEALGCSTQPILYHFRTIEEIRQETYRNADEFHTQYISPKGERGRNPLLELGMNYTQFGHEEKNLFRFLFQSNQFAGFRMENLMNDPNLAGMLQMVSAGMSCSEAEAKEVFLGLFAAAHGMASLLANNAMEYEEEMVKKVLENTFFSLKGRRGTN